MHDQSGLLGHLRVLELTDAQAGATCTQTLAWLGAQVIKIEPPHIGEPGRRVGKPTGRSADGIFFFLHNNNKKSVTLNLAHDDGQALFRQLLSQSHAVVNNLVPGRLEHLGWSYERLQEANPSIIYATISGYGAEGPYHGFPSTEAIAEAMGGGMGTTGFPDRPPTLPWGDAGETGAGLHAALAILAAYADSMVTGRAHHVDISMQDAVMNLIRTRLWPGYDSHQPYPRAGNWLPAVLDDSNHVRPGRRAGDWLLTVPGSAYPCKPGGPNDYVYVFALSTAMWEGCLRAMGRHDLIGDTRYQELTTRLERGEEVEAMFSDWTRTLTKYEALEALGREGVPCGAIMDTAELLSDAHLKARDMMVQIEHPEYGTLTMPGCPIKVSGHPLTLTPAPLLGADNTNVYGSLLGLDTTRLQALREQGVI